MTDRIRGCLLGGAVGDALGAPVEFDAIDRIRSRFGPDGITELAEAYGRAGAITDDTQMTLFTAEGLIRAYVRAAHRGPATCRRWSTTPTRAGSPRRASAAGDAADEGADGWLDRRPRAARAPRARQHVPLGAAGTAQRARSTSR